MSMKYFYCIDIYSLVNNQIWIPLRSSSRAWNSHFMLTTPQTWGKTGPKLLQDDADWSLATGSTGMLIMEIQHNFTDMVHIIIVCYLCIHVLIYPMLSYGWLYIFGVIQIHRIPSRMLILGTLYHVPHTQIRVMYVCMHAYCVWLFSQFFL